MSQCQASTPGSTGSSPQRAVRELGGASGGLTTGHTPLPHPHGEGRQAETELGGSGSTGSMLSHNLTSAPQMPAPIPSPRGEVPTAARSEAARAPAWLSTSF